MKRHIATVATENCKRGLSILVASLRAHGWKKAVQVYVPDGDPLESMPGCEIIKGNFWWKDTDLVQCRNHAALLKCTILFDEFYKDGDSVLYMDGADTAMLADPDEIFELFESRGNMIAACPFCQAVLNKHKHPALLDKAHLVSVYRDVFDRRAPYYNNGVWLFRAGREAAMLGRWWQALEVSEATHGVVKTNWEDGTDNVLVGDQQTFNLMMRLMDGRGLTFDLPEEWNFRGGKRIASECKIEDGSLIHSSGLRVKIAHSSGPYSLSEELVEIAVKGSSLPIVEGGVGLVKGVPV